MTPMTRLTLAVGGVLIVAGLIGFFASGAASVTALIPAFVGLLLVITGLVARKPDLTKHALHVAMVVALFGIVGSIGNVIEIGDLFDGSAERPAAIVLSAVMLVVLVAYLIAGIRSFRAARRG